MRNDLIFVSLLQAIHGHIDSTDQNSYDNTTIQYFESPHEETTLTASVSATSTDPTKLTWGGIDANGVNHAAGWSWGYGGKWS